MRTLRFALVCILVAGVAPLLIPAEQALAGTPCVNIHEIYHNSPGSDTGSNSSLNGEWALVQNWCRSSKNISGWKLHDAANHVYTFSTFILGATATVKVHTGSGTNISTDRYWGSGSYIWNKDKDTGTLVKSDGTVDHTCSYNNSSASYKICTST